MKKPLCAMVAAGAIFLLSFPVCASVRSGEEKDGYTWQAQYPIVTIAGDAAAQKVINDDLNGYRDRLHDELRRGEQYSCYEYYKVHYEDEDVLSISLLLSRVPTRTTCGNTFHSYDLVYDKHTGKRIPLYNYVRLTTSDLADYAKGHSYTQSGTFLGYGNHADYILERKGIPENYFLMGGGVVCVVFQPYEICSGPGGACYVKIEAKDVDYFNQKNQW